MRTPGHSAVPFRGVRLLLPAFVVATVTSAQAQDAHLTASVDTTVLHVGDRIAFELSVDLPLGWTVEWPDTLEVGPFEVIEANPEPTTEQGGRALGRARYLLTSFQLGELEIPSIEVQARTPEGQTTTLVSDPFVVGVESVGLDESGEMRDIKGPLSLPREWGRTLGWLVALLALLAALRYAWGRFRNRPPVELRVAVPPPRPFSELAYEALDALASSTLLQQGRVKEFHIRLSEIVRSYIEGQLAVPAMEMTTGEVVTGLYGAALGADLCGEFRRFLDQCDLVKFAKLRPPEETSRALLDDARRLVDRTSGWKSPRLEDPQTDAELPSGDGGPDSEPASAAGSLERQGELAASKAEGQEP